MTALLVYCLGVIAVAWRADGSVLAKVGLALAWPVAPAAFVVTLGILLAAIPVAFPWVGAIAAALGVLAWVVLA